MKKVLCMKRYALEALLQWKQAKDRMPMVLWGARQVGKTWLMREFGRVEFKKVIYANFDSDPSLCGYFETSLNPERIIKSLESHFNEKIVPEDTLIIFDEIQECQRAKDSLKYFTENAPQYYILAAGSFLGVAEGKFPVGKVNELTLYPMSFYEFLEAIGRDRLLEQVKTFDMDVLEPMRELLESALKLYFYVGGMPAVVRTYIDYGGDLLRVRKKQKEILSNYRNDFSKHISVKDIPKVRMLWDSIPVHLAREKKKFIYKEIKTGARAAEFENAMNWLLNTGLVYKVSRTLTPQIPLERNPEREVFKLFMHDVGLLCAQSNIDMASFYLSDPKIFSDFRGAITEQYVCQSLVGSGFFPLFYWGRERGNAEIDFLIQYKGNVVPIEAKSEKNTLAKSMKVYMELYKPTLAIKTSLCSYRYDEPLLSLPLYMLESIETLIADLLQPIRQRPVQGSLF